MSLIPSESTSFPDLLGRRLGASKKSNWRVPAPPEVEQTPPPKVASPPPPPSSPVLAKPAAAAAPHPPLPPASTPPPVAAREAPAQALRPAPAPARHLEAKENAPNEPQEKEESVSSSGHFQPLLPLQSEDGDWDDEMLWDDPMPRLNLLRRRRVKLVRFMTVEVTALIILIVSANLALSSRAPDDWITVVAKVITIVMAIALAVVPILFYRLPETLSRERR
jgi:hypothetical protein